MTDKHHLLDCFIQIYCFNEIKSFDNYMNWFRLSCIIAKYIKQIKGKDKWMERDYYWLFDMISKMNKEYKGFNDCS